MPFDFSCPECGFTMEVDNSAAGELCTCSQCDVEVTIVRSTVAVTDTADETQLDNEIGKQAVNRSEPSEQEINPAIAFAVRLLVIAILIGSITGGGYAIYYGFTVPWVGWTYRGYVNIDDIDQSLTEHQRRLIEDAKQNKGPPDYSHLKVDLPPPTEEEMSMGPGVDPSEFRGGLGAGGGDQEEAGSRGGFDPEAIFTRLDENGDGVLEGDEISDRLSQRMDQIDSDSDGKISSEEFLEAIQQRLQGNRGDDNSGIPQP